MLLLSSRRSVLLFLLLTSLSLTFAQTTGPGIPYLSAWKWIFYIGIIVAFIDGYGIVGNTATAGTGHSAASLLTGCLPCPLSLSVSGRE